MNERITALGAVAFILGAVINLSAVGAVATGNAVFANHYFSPGLALELFSYMILGVGVVMKGNRGTHPSRAVGAAQGESGLRTSTPAPNALLPGPNHTGRKADETRI